MMPIMTALLLCASLLLPQEPTDFRALHRQIAPAGTEAFEQIPWRTDLLAAAAAARASDQLLFLWSMNGHPLGCV